jgi:hypothetical protein
MYDGEVRPKHRRRRIQSIALMDEPKDRIGALPVDSHID